MIDKDLFERYKEVETALSLEEESELFYKYVYASNKLEGNSLTLVQTTEILSKNTIPVSDKPVPLFDVLEQKGMYKALIRVLTAVREKEPLSIKFIKELNWLLLSSIWKDQDKYIGYKEAGQRENEFKIKQNKIQITRNNITQSLLPESTPENVEGQMNVLVQQINKSEKDVLEKGCYIAQELWLKQPFIDGNKRTGRLLITFMTMKEGCPLFVYDTEQDNYNDLLISQYLDKKPNLLLKYIKQKIEKVMIERIENEKGMRKPRGYSMIL